MLMSKSLGNDDDCDFIRWPPAAPDCEREEGEHQIAEGADHDRPRGECSQRVNPFPHRVKLPAEKTDTIGIAENWCF